MAVIAIHPISGKGGDNQGIQDRQAARRWILSTDNRYDDETTVLAQGINNGDFPTPFVDTHPTWPGLLCRSLSALQDESAPYKWIVTAQFSSEPFPLWQQLNQFVAPLDRPAIITQNKSQRMEAQIQDGTGNAYCNSAGDPLDPPIELPRGYPIYTIVKNVATTPFDFMSKGDVINNAPFFIEDLYVYKYQARLVDWHRSSLQSEIDLFGNPWQYYILTWSMEIDIWSQVLIPQLAPLLDKNGNPVVDQYGNPVMQPVLDANGNIKGSFAPCGWLVVYLDQGLRQLAKPGGNKRVNILDSSLAASAVTTPVMLNGAGQVHPNPSARNAIYGVRHGYQEVDFNEFPLR